MSTEQRFIDLESKIAFQEKTIDLLKEVLEEHEIKVTRQQHQLEYLGRQLLALGESSNGSGDQGDEPPPPHYHPQT